MQKSYLRLLCKAKLIAVLGVGWPWLVGTKSDSREWFLNQKHASFTWMNLNCYLCFAI